MKVHDMSCPNCKAAFKVAGNLGECFYCKTHSLSYPHFVLITVNGKPVQLEFCSGSCAEKTFRQKVPLELDQTEWVFQHSGDPIQLSEERFQKLLDQKAED